MSAVSLPIVEYHFLMNVPANCLNRDDTGLPKTFFFSNAVRNAISSQCMKYAWRHSPEFVEYFGEVAKRTRQLPELVGTQLAGMGYEPKDIHDIKNALKLGESADKGADESDEKKTAKKNVDLNEHIEMKKLSFYSQDEIDAIVRAIDRMWKSDKDHKAFGNTKDAHDHFLETLANEIAKEKVVLRPTVDQALFGRMVTDNVVKEIDASMQVSRAMSTGAAHMESDYFTAVDDVLLGNDSGHAVVGHLNSTDYDSACFYIHAVIDLGQFARNIGMTEASEDEVKDIVRHLSTRMLDIMAHTLPSGKQNSYEAHVFPEVILVQVKSRKLPENLCNAFRNADQMVDAKASVQALAEETERSEKVFGVIPDHAVWLKTRDDYAVPDTPNITVTTSINEMMHLLDSWCTEAVH